MANICQYKAKVKGKRNACYAFFGSMSCSDGKWINEENGTDDETILIFEGYCKWSVDCYCKPWKGAFPVEIPDNYNQAYEEAENKYWYHTVQERSKMFDVEVWCYSVDTDDPYAFLEGLDDIADEILADLGDMPLGLYEHYDSGKEIHDDCPEEIKFEFD
jgi:hypothetical protein